MRATGSREIYSNPWMRLREDSVERADGSTGVYAVVDKPSCALVIPLQDDHLHLVEQFRYPLGVRRWEFPQGTAPEQRALEPVELAARELREETGLRAGRWTDLGVLDVAAGLASQRGHAFLATELSAGEHARELEEQDMRSAWFPRAEVEEMMARGDITDAQSLAAYARFLLHERGS